MLLETEVLGSRLNLKPIFVNGPAHITSTCSLIIHHHCPHRDIVLSRASTVPIASLFSVFRVVFPRHASPVHRSVPFPWFVSAAPAQRLSANLPLSLLSQTLPPLSTLPSTPSPDQTSRANWEDRCRLGDSYRRLCRGARRLQNTDRGWTVCQDWLDRETAAKTGPDSCCRRRDVPWG